MNEIVWPTIDSKHLIVDSKQMLIVEKEMFSDGMPQEALMEKAGIQISRWLLKRKPLLKHGITVFIGPGHNGGDGAVIARELFLKGFLVKVWCPFPIKKTLTNNHLNYLTSIGVTKLVEPPDANGKELWLDAVFGNNQTNNATMRRVSPLSAATERDITEAFFQRSFHRPVAAVGLGWWPAAKAMAKAGADPRTLRNPLKYAILRMKPSKKKMGKRAPQKIIWRRCAWPTFIIASSG